MTVTASCIYYYSISRESPVSLSWFLCRSSIVVKLEFGEVGFYGGRKTVELGEKPSEQGENQQRTQSTYDI